MRPLLQNIAFDGIDLDRVFNDPEDTHEVCPWSLSLGVQAADLHRTAGPLSPFGNLQVAHPFESDRLATCLRS